MLQNPDILREVENPHISHDGIYRDVTDGQYYQQHPIFGQNDKALILLGYFDDLEVANPLGSKAKIHKLGMPCVFYCLLTSEILGFQALELLPRPWNFNAEGCGSSVQHCVSNPSKFAYLG